MRGIEIFQKPSYREISPMRDRPMRGPPVQMRWRAGSDSDVHANFFCDVMKLAHTYKLVYIVCVLLL